MPVFRQTEISQLIKKSGLYKKEIASRTGYNIRTNYRWNSRETTPRKTITDWLLRQVRINGQFWPAEKPAFTFIDLFAGIGGFRIAFESVGELRDFTSEWGLPCRTTYQANFPCDHPVEEEIPAHDVLFPGANYYHDGTFPKARLSMLGVKSTCKHRWRKTLSEAARIPSKDLLALEPGISENQTYEMQANKVQLVLPR